jgi:hypothetical protein
VADSILTHYVLDGGWSMLLLVPASVVSVAVALRSAWLTRGSELQRIAAGLPGEGRADAAYSAALQLYGTLQPLVAMYVLAPLVGLLGGLTTLIPIQVQLLTPGARQIEVLTKAYQAALLPLFWGVAVATFSYAVFALLRARIFRAESELFR